MEEIEKTEEKINDSLETVFKPKPTKETNKDLKKQEHTINLLTDSKIADIKSILA